MGGRYNLKPFQAGQPLLEQLTAARMNALIDAINRSQVIFGDNIYGQRTPGGAIVRTRFTPQAAQEDPDITFFLSDATEVIDDVETNKVFVSDGKINGEFPTGMGSGEYVLDLADPADSLICAQMTFDPDTQEILSRDLAVFAAADFPEDEIVAGVGTFTLMLGFTFFDADDDFRVIMTRVGDINFEFINGAVDGVPGVIAIPALSKWMELPLEA